MRGKNVTIAEVARLAGVSTATAGRVLGGYGYSSAGIRAKVEAAARQLGYRPNQLARGLSSGRTRTIGVVAGDIESPFYAAILRGISNVLDRLEFGMLITNSDENAGRESRAVGLLLEKQVDGLIVSPCDTAGAAHLRDAAARVPVVLIDRDIPAMAVDSVGVDNVAGARDGTRRLLAAGHRRIGLLAELLHDDPGGLDRFLDAAERGAATAEGLYPSWQRLSGYLDAHREAGIAVDRRLVRRVGAYSVAAAERAARELLSGAGRPTALLTADGTMTAGAMAAVRHLGLTIPDALSLVAFDDLDWLALVGPGIDAIAQPRRALGEAAATLLHDRIAGDDGPPRRVRLATKWIARGSIRAAPAPPARPPAS